MNISELLGLLFLARDITHAEHLNTRSYARHMALGEFYTGIIPLADALAEAWQGQNKLVGPISLQTVKSPVDVVKVLEHQMNAIKEGRTTAVGSCPSLQAKVDDIISLYSSTLYKLKYLE